MGNTPLNLKIKTLEEWGIDLQAPFIISGPCSAETEDQVLQTAKQIKKHNPEIKVFRAGIWKPRTRPNSFEGIGLKGFKWLRKVKEETGLLTTVEVANSNHVYEALKHGIDILWIGARTTVNPFSVQEISEALHGVDVPVLIKNPINPDLQLWIGAIERVHQAGITRLGVIHRGFSTFQNGPYRNVPQWHIAIELKRLIPDLTMICDPSHIAGNVNLLHKISQRAIHLAMDGLMIESHIDPENAWSDRQQQITPVQMKNLIAGLDMRTAKNNLEAEEILEMLRNDIDEIDYQLLEVMARRLDVVEKIGLLKQLHHMTIYQVNRWDELLNDRLKKGKELGLNDQTVKDLYELIHLLSINIQEKQINNKAKMKATKRRSFSERTFGGFNWVL